MNIDELLVPASGSQTNFSITRSESRGSGRDCKQPAPPSCRTVAEYPEINAPRGECECFVGLDLICDAFVVYTVA